MEKLDLVHAASETDAPPSGQLSSLPAAKPKRIQRKRTKGWRMPEDTVFVGRPTRWGNPFIVGEHGTASECVLKFALSMDFFDIRDAKAKLRGKDLACWCSPDSPCHADILLEVANA